MIISIVNHTNGQVTDEALQTVIRAINRQINEDFASYWSLPATLRLEGRTTEEPDKIQVPDLRGDAVIYLWDELNVSEALGYHFRNNRGIPFGFVYTELAKEIGEPWSVTLSHEALELLGDPQANLLVMGPHPKEEVDRDVFHWYEMCDAVQVETYEIDGVAVSNFLLPLYFTGTRDTDEVGARNDFLGRTYDGQTLRSFRVNPGGYIGFFDPVLGRHDAFTIEGDTTARSRLEIKGRARETRRSVRYREFAAREKLRRGMEEMEEIRLEVLDGMRILAEHDGRFRRGAIRNLEGTLRRYGFALNDYEMERLRSSQEAVADMNDEELVRELAAGEALLTPEQVLTPEEEALLTPETEERFRRWGHRH